MTNYATQQQNQDMVSLLASQFRLLYNPVHSFADAIGMLQMFPGLRGLWPGSVVGASGQMNDLSTNGLHLTNNSNALFDNDGLAPYTEYDGTADYHSRTDEAAFDIIGNEAYIANPGLTLGCWMYPQRNTNAESLISKADGVSFANTSYYLFNRGDVANDPAEFLVSSGAAGFLVRSTDSVVPDTWQFVVGRYIPSSEIRVWVNGNSTVNTTSIPATLANSTIAFNIAARNAGNFYDGRVSLAFLCASAVPNIFINTFYQMTAPLFNISI